LGDENMSLEELKTALENREYEKVISMFPQDRRPRLVTISVMTALLRIEKERVKFNKNCNWAAGGKIASTIYQLIGEPPEYLMVRISAKILVPNADIRYRRYAFAFDFAFIIGEDDSGFWVEVLDRFPFDYGDLTVGEIRRRLSCGKELSTITEWRLGNGELYRVQGDVNVSYRVFGLDNGVVHNIIDLAVTTVVPEISKYFESVRNLISSFYEFLSSFSQEKISSNNLGDFIAEAKKTEEGEQLENLAEVIQEKLIEAYNRIEEFYVKNLVVPEYELDFENHKIQLKEATVPVSVGWNSGMNVFLVFGEAEMTVKSPHHKEVTTFLSRGIYTLAKSGGLGMRDIEQLMLSFASYGVDPVKGYYVKKEAKKIEVRRIN
jgi:hypothetical protein